MSIRDLINTIEEQMEELVNNLPRVRADKIGLDSRAGSRVYVDTTNDLIIVIEHGVRNLEYYGGFEYVSEDSTAIVGDYKVYGIEYDGRVDDAIDCYRQLNEETFVAAAR